MTEFSFSTLSQPPVEEAAAEDSKMFTMEMAAEQPVSGDPPKQTGNGAEAEEEEVVPEAAAKNQEAVESESPEPEETPAQEEGNPLESLMQLAAGKVASDEVKLKAEPTAKSASPFQALSAQQKLDPVAERALDDLVSTLSETELAEQSTRQEQPKPASAATSPAQPVQQQVVAAPPASGAGQLGEVAGRAIAEVASFPFLALSSAARHLTNRFQQSSASPAPATANASLAASRGPKVPLAMANTLEEITDWKCERIEKAAHSVIASADDLMGTEDFLTWDDEIGNIATQRGIAARDVVRSMHSDPEFSDLKERMDRLWEAHPEKVSKFRDACDDFERNIRNVVKEFPNSKDGIKERVAKAMKDVEEKTEHLPGFGEKMGEYTKALAERVRELAQMISEFVTALVRKIGGNTRDSDLSMS